MTDRSTWEPALLALTGLLAIGLPWRVHVSAARSPQRWLVVPDLLVSLTVAVATAWAVVSVVDGRAATHVVPAIATAVLAGAAEQARSRSGLDPSAPVLPRWLVPSVLLTSVAAAVGWGIVDDGTRAAEAGVAVLVMTGAASAILAVPAAFAAGASLAKAAGVRLDSIATAEAATGIDTLVLEKDGTLTTGDLTVVSVDPHDPDHDRNLRWFAGALEKASDHRIGRAVATLAGRGRLAEVEVVPGCGIHGTVDRHPVRVGSPEWMGFEPAPTIWTTVGVEVDGRPLGTITVADDVRPELTRDVTRLTGLGIQLVLVSADSVERTQHVARLAGIDTFRAASTPADLDEVIRDLCRDGRQVATAGMAAPPDGILSITTHPVDREPTLVADDCSPARIADAITTARGTAERVARARRATVTMAAVAAAAAAIVAPGPVVAAAAGAAVFTAAALVAVSR